MRRYMFFILIVSLLILSSSLPVKGSLNIENTKNIIENRTQPGQFTQKAYFALKSYKWIRYPYTKNGIALLQVTIVYYGTDVLLNVQTTLSFHQDIEIVTEQPIKLGSWEPGTQKTIIYSINISSFPAKGFATINIQYSAIARRVSDGFDILNVVGGGTISFQLSFPASYQLSYFITPSSLKRNSINILTIVFQNSGTGTIYDLVSRISINGATIVGSFQPIIVKIPKLEAGKNYTIQIKVIPIGTQVSLTFDSDYINEQGEHIDEKFTSPLSVIQSFNVILVTEPSKIRTGSSQKIQVKIINLGEIPLHNCILYIRPGQGSKLVVDPTYFKIGDIQVNETKSVYLELSVPNTITGTQVLQYTLIYNTENNEKSQVTGTISIFAVEKAQLVITSIEIVPKEPVIGQTIIVSVTIINLGSLPLNKVNISAYYSLGLTPLRQESYFIGQLQPQYPMSIPFSFKAIKGGKQNIDFRIRFTDVYGLNWTLIKSVNININSTVAQGKNADNIKGKVRRKGLFAPLSFGTLFIVFIVAIVIIYYVYRKVYGGRK